MPAAPPPRQKRPQNPTEWLRISLESRGVSAAQVAQRIAVGRHTVGAVYLQAPSITDDTVDAVAAELLACDKLERLHLRDLQLSGAGWGQLADALGRMRLLQLEIKYSSLPVAAVEALARAVARCRSLRALVVVGCALGDEHAEALGAMMEDPQCGLEELWLGYNAFTEAGVKRILRGARQHERVHTLSLSGLSAVTLEDGEICELLGGMQKLRELSLRSCAITDEGADRLSLAVRRMRGLERLDAFGELSNHGLELLLDAAPRGCVVGGWPKPGIAPELIARCGTIDHNEFESYAVALWTRTSVDATRPGGMSCLLQSCTTTWDGQFKLDMVRGLRRNDETPLQAALRRLYIETAGVVDLRDRAADLPYYFVGDTRDVERGELSTHMRNLHAGVFHVVVSFENGDRDVARIAREYDDAARPHAESNAIGLLPYACVGRNRDVLTARPQEGYPAMASQVFHATAKIFGDLVDCLEATSVVPLRWDDAHVATGDDDAVPASPMPALVFRGTTLGRPLGPPRLARMPVQWDVAERAWRLTSEARKRVPVGTRPPRR